MDNINIVGEYSYQLAEYLYRLFLEQDMNVAAFYADNHKGQERYNNIPVLSVDELDSKTPVYFSFFERTKMHEYIRRLPDNQRVSCISPFSEIGPGNLIGHGVTIGFGATMVFGCRIGNYAVIGRNAIFDRNVHIGAMAFIGSRVTLCDNITVGDNTFIGTGTTVLPGVKIGNNCRIAAGSLLTKDVPDNAKAIGHPAHIEDNTHAH